MNPVFFDVKTPNKYKQRRIHLVGNFGLISIRRKQEKLRKRGGCNTKKQHLLQ